MIPVSLGAHKKDYEYQAPPNSFIHVEDFQSPWALASYLIQLDENDEEYNKYFEWRSQGKFIDPSSNFLCRICAAIHYNDFNKPRPWPSGSTYDKINVCLPPSRWYWDRES